MFLKMVPANDGTYKNNLAPFQLLTPCFVYFSAIIIQEQEEKAYQHGKETKCWLPSQTPGEALAVRARDPPVFFQWHECFS